MHVRVVGPNFERRAQVRDRFGAAALLVTDYAEEMLSVEVTRRAGQDLGVKPLRLGELSGLMVPDGALKQLLEFPRARSRARRP